jgi:hypothetical protein
MWHTDAALNIIEIIDPNVERVTALNRGQTNLPTEYKEIYTEIQITTVHPTLDSFFRKPKTPGTTSNTLCQT